MLHALITYNQKYPFYQPWLTFGLWVIKACSICVMWRFGEISISSNSRWSAHFHNTHFLQNVTSAKARIGGQCIRRRVVLDQLTLADIWTKLENMYSPTCFLVHLCRVLLSLRRIRVSLIATLTTPLHPLASQLRPSGPCLHPRVLEPRRYKTYLGLNASADTSCFFLL